MNYKVMSPQRTREYLVKYSENEYLAAIYGQDNETLRMLSKMDQSEIDSILYRNEDYGQKIEKLEEIPFTVIRDILKKLLN